MIRLLTDENFNQNIVRGLRRRLPQLDLISARDAGLARQPDMFLLHWAAQQNRAILTHDIKTMVRDAKQLIRPGEAMAGVIFVPDQLPIGRAINDLELALECKSESEIRDAVTYLPL
jgi:hypothetical protein